jgi:alpha-L-fucosidase
VKSPDQLLDLYFKSVGRGASLLLNLPPNRRGQLHEHDIRTLMAFRARREAIFADNLVRDAEITSSDVRGGSQAYGAQNLVDGNPETYWATDDDVKAPGVVLTFRKPITFNVIELREYLPLGQRVERFAVDVEREGAWHEIGRGTSIGNRRLLRVDTCTTIRVRIRITESPVCPAISKLGLYLDPSR